MNRIELITLFTSLKLFSQKKDYESIDVIIDTVLREAEVKPNKRKTKEIINEQET